MFRLALLPGRNLRPWFLAGFRWRNPSCEEVRVKYLLKFPTISYTVTYLYLGTRPIIIIPLKLTFILTVENVRTKIRTRGKLC